MESKNGGTRRIDWLNHFIEFIVVVIGILLAFQLNTCSSEKTQAKTIETHLNQIKKETEFNRETIEQAIQDGEEKVEKLKETLSLIRKGENYNKVNQNALQLLAVGGVYIRKNAYETLKTSSDLRLMKDFYQKQKIVDLYEYYKWVESYDEASMQVFNTDFYPYLMDHFDMSNGQVQKAEVYKNKVFTNSLSAYQATTFNRVHKYKDCLKEINKYLESN